jgi:hypothetical protein
VLKKAAESTDGHFVNVKQSGQLKTALMDVINYYARARKPVHTENTAAPKKK